MCEVFISADPQSYDARTRSVRLHGVVTSIEAMVAQGRIPADTSVAIRSLDAKAVLHALPQGWGRPQPDAQPRPTAADSRVRTLHVAARRHA